MYAIVFKKKKLLKSLRIGLKMSQLQPFPLNLALMIKLVSAHCKRDCIWSWGGKPGLPGITNQRSTGITKDYQWLLRVTGLLRDYHEMTDSYMRLVPVSFPSGQNIWALFSYCRPQWRIWTNF